MSPEDAADHFGLFAKFAAMHAPISSKHTRAQLGRKPAQLGLFEGMDQLGYVEP
jgi:hypothetical protein